ncbi:30S ribosomal protein S12 methylthiotransferase RimO [Ruminococcaceae bacterium OttesenSCG-928-A16]|nr:30S ribosomal protein S12 methylthiotransferase RimO [Ruminococcaceae bacterium OttesenSCG-928-A16]
MKIAVVSLGCPKNQADADVFCRALLEDGNQTVASLEEAEAIIVNTCGFIQSAKEEAIENILQACSYKKQNPAVKVLVTGCLAQRYQKEIVAEIPEVDAVVGLGSNGQLPQILRQVASSAQVVESYGPKGNLPLGGKRVIGTPRQFAWLKIAEGCSNACSYCAIPSIRGPLRSRPLQSCIAEAEWLAEQGVREIVLVAQDVTAYGDDTGQNQIAELLDALNQIEGIGWIRLLYAYPERITPEFADAMARNSKVVTYLDLPVQHINDEILTSMRRKGDSATIRSAIQMLRQKMPDITLRTSLITGYPGETEAQFEELCAFVKETGFDRLGCFAYSPEEGTLAEKMPNQVPEEERRRRADVIMQLQSNIMAEKQQQMIGKTITVLCDELDEEENVWLCRSKADAPEIDANVLLPGTAALAPGVFYNVRVTGADVYDLYAELA